VKFFCVLHVLPVPGPVQSELERAKSSARGHSVLVCPVQPKRPPPLNEAAALLPPVSAA
jgi:hypothetical protein